MLIGSRLNQNLEETRWELGSLKDVDGRKAHKKPPKPLRDRFIFKMFSYM
jgi:hypothetical protein